VGKKLQTGLFTGRPEKRGAAEEEIRIAVLAKAINIGGREARRN